MTNFPTPPPIQQTHLLTRPLANYTPRRRTRRRRSNTPLLIASIAIGGLCGIMTARLVLVVCGI